MSVHAPPSRITGLIGPDGAGKTTRFNVCSGLQATTSGRVSLDGHDLHRIGPSRRTRLELGWTFQRLELFTGVTVRENVEFGVEARSLSWDPLSQLGLRASGRSCRREVRDDATQILDDTGLLPLADRVVGSLSTGQGRLVVWGTGTRGTRRRCCWSTSCVRTTRSPSRRGSCSPPGGATPSCSSCWSWPASAAWSPGC